MLSVVVVILHNSSESAAPPVEYPFRGTTYISVLLCLCLCFIGTDPHYNWYQRIGCEVPKYKTKLPKVLSI